MKNVSVFLDTNILCYAHDSQTGEKHARASALLNSFWSRDEIPFVSIQVLQEFCAFLLKNQPLGRVEELVSIYMRWNVVENTTVLLMDGLSIQKKWKTSFWDSLVIAAAKKAGAREIWSEDFNDGQDFGGIKVRNPLK